MRFGPVLLYGRWQTFSVFGRAFPRAALPPTSPHLRSHFGVRCRSDEDSLLQDKTPGLLAEAGRFG